MWIMQMVIADVYSSNVNFNEMDQNFKYQLFIHSERSFDRIKTRDIENHLSSMHVCLRIMFI